MLFKDYLLYFPNFPGRTYPLFPPWDLMYTSVKHLLINTIILFYVLIVSTSPINLRGLGEPEKKVKLILLKYLSNLKISCISFIFPGIN